MRPRRSVLSGIGAALCVSAARAAPAPFQWKSLTVITSTGAGGTYDLLARLVARHMPKYLPGNPTAIVQNMPGGGNVVATNYMYNNALKDGTVIAVINDAIPLHQVIDGRGVRFDADKFNWLGSPGDRNSVTFAWHTSGIKTIEDVMRREVPLGGTGVGSSIVIYPTAMNKVLGTKFKIVLGYRSSSEVFLAMERGEIAARSVGLTSVLAEYPDWITEKKINFLVQLGAATRSDAARRAASDRARQDRRAAPDPDTDLRADLARPALSRAAGRSRRSRRDLARGLRVDHARSRLHRRHQAALLRGRSPKRGGGRALRPPDRERRPPTSSPKPAPSSALS